MKSKKIILLGMAGVGKSSIGKLLAKETHLPFIDLDTEIERVTQEPLQRSLDRLGDDAFLKLENRVFTNLCHQDAVYAPGGSFIYLLEKLTTEFFFIYLHEKSEVLLKRIHNLSNRGIVGIKEKSFETLVSERRDLGKQYANLFIECHNRPKQKIVDEILKTVT